MSADLTRNRLLDTAARLFHEQGYASTAVSTILREADVNSGSLYYHFSSKEDLVLAVLDRYLELLAPILIEPIESLVADPIERVFALLDLYRQGLEETNCRLGCPIGNLALELSDSLPAARSRINANFEAWYGHIRRWLEEATDRFPKATDLNALAQFVLTTMEGAVMQARAHDSIEPFDTSVGQLLAYFQLLTTHSETVKT